MDGYLETSSEIVSRWMIQNPVDDTVYPKKYAHGFVVLCFVVVMQSFTMNSHEVFIHIHQGCFAGPGAIVRLPQCQWSKPDGYGKISQCITTTKHSKAKTVCIFLGIYSMLPLACVMMSCQQVTSQYLSQCWSNLCHYAVMLKETFPDFCVKNKYIAWQGIVCGHLHYIFNCI